MVWEPQALRDGSIAGVAHLCPYNSYAASEYEIAVQSERVIQWFPTAIIHWSYTEQNRQL